MKIVFKSTVFAIIIVLTLVFISVTSVFAAPMQGGNKGSDQDLEGKWKSELTTLQKFGYLEQQIPKWLDVWSKTHHSHGARAKKNMYANEIHLALKQARRLAAEHAGFDANGQVIDKIQAAQSVEKLATYLHEVDHVFRHRFHH